MPCVGFSPAPNCNKPYARTVSNARASFPGKTRLEKRWRFCATSPVPSVDTTRRNAAVADGHFVDLRGVSMRAAFDGGFSGMPVLVTGHTGFKGSWLSLWLKELGAEVTGYSLDPPTVPNNFQLCRLDKKIRDVRGDVRDLDGLKQVIERNEPHLVIHLAAQPLVMAGYGEPKGTFDVTDG